jgi:HK97 family phage prohead protease
MTQKTLWQGKVRFKALGDPSKDGEVLIEGYANKFEVDSYGERLDPKSVRLDRFRQNPILLFNHNTDYPIGRVLEVETRDDGLWVKAALSAADDPRVNYIRALVQDGTLCCFSVRLDIESFDDVMPDPDLPGKKLIKNWELQELSIVSIPAQAASTFSIAKSLLSECGSLSEARLAILKSKGAPLAEYVSSQIEVIAGREGLDRSALVKRLADASAVPETDVVEFLGGNLELTSEAFLKACSEALECEASELQARVKKTDEEAEKKDDDAEPLVDLTLDAAIQECVAEALPALLADGKDQATAVAEAIAKCSSEKGCKWVPNKDAMARFLAICEKQADQGLGTPVPTTPIPPATMQTEDPIYLEMKAQTSLLGSLVTEVKAMTAACSEMTMKLGEALAKMTAAQGAPAVLPASVPSETLPPPDLTNPPMLSLDAERTKAIEDKINARLAGILEQVDRVLQIG